MITRLYKEENINKFRQFCAYHRNGFSRYPLCLSASVVKNSFFNSNTKEGKFQMNFCEKTAILFRIRNLEGEGGGISKRFDSEEQFRREALRNV